MGIQYFFSVYCFKFFYDVNKKMYDEVNIYYPIPVTNLIPVYIALGCAAGLCLGLMLWGRRDPKQDDAHRWFRPRADVYVVVYTDFSISGGGLQQGFPWTGHD